MKISWTAICSLLSASMLAGVQAAPLAGPQTVVEGIVSAPIDQTWKLFEPFGPEIQKWWHIYSSVELKGEDKVGALRALTTSGEGRNYTERLVLRDAVKHREQYELVSASPAIPGVDKIVTTVEMTATQDNKTTVRWSAEFNAPPNVLELIKSAQTKAYQAGIDGLNAYLQNKTVPAPPAGTDVNEQDIVIALTNSIQKAVSAIVTQLAQPEDKTQFDYGTYPAPFDNLPKMLKGLPQSQFIRPKNIGNIAERLAEYTWSQDTFLQHYFKINTTAYVDAFGEAFFGKYAKPNQHILKTWATDDEFVRQLTSGLNPLVISVCNDLAKVPKDMQGLTGTNNKSIADLIQGKKLFMLDYNLLDGLPQQGQKVQYGPIVLLENTEANGLKLLGIQLTRYTDKKNEVFTPQETGKKFPNKWLFAKMHVACADNQYHQFISHLGFGHLGVEPFAIAHYNIFQRQHKDHKIGLLLDPHFKDTIGINFLARETLVRPDQPITDGPFGPGTSGGLTIFAKAWSQYNFTSGSFVGDLKQRGFDETGSDGLKDYYYRDDGFKIWNALKKYVASVVKSVYANDQQVQQDAAIQAFHQELVAPERANIPSVPAFNSIDVLVESLTNIIYQCSAFHSSVNYGQFDYLSYVPSRPDAIKAPMPFFTDSDITQQYIQASLPGPLYSQFQIVFAYLLSTPPSESELLSELTASKDVFPAQHADFVAELDLVSKGINARNEELVKAGNMPYPWLLPEKIAVSVQM